MCCRSSLVALVATPKPASGDAEVEAWELADALLRDAELAVELLTEALASRAAGDAKGRALITLDLAASRVVAGEPDDACLLVESALAAVPGAPVRPIVSWALAVRADMARWDGTKAVVRLDALLAEITHSADRRE